jgi:hypothetical protein
VLIPSLHVTLCNRTLEEQALSSPWRPLTSIEILDLWQKKNMATRRSSARRVPLLLGVPFFRFALPLPVHLLVSTYSGQLCETHLRYTSRHSAHSVEVKLRNIDRNPFGLERGPFLLGQGQMIYAVRPCTMGCVRAFPPKTPSTNFYRFSRPGVKLRKQHW